MSACSVYILSLPCRVGIFHLLTMHLIALMNMASAAFYQRSSISVSSAGSNILSIVSTQRYLNMVTEVPGYSGKCHLNSSKSGRFPLSIAKLLSGSFLTPAYASLWLNEYQYAIYKNDFPLQRLEWLLVKKVPYIQKTVSMTKEAPGSTCHSRGCAINIMLAGLILVGRKNAD